MNKLDKKVNISAFIARTIIGLFFYIGYVVLLILPASIYEEPEIKILLLILGGILIFFILIYNLILPFFIYKYHRYELKDDEVLVKSGIIFRRVTYIPIKRIQHIQKLVGPVQMIFNLSTIQIFTAGSADNIIGLNSLVADGLIDEINSKLNQFLKEEEVNEKI